MLLLAKAEIDRAQGRQPDAGDLEAAARILASLGIPQSRPATSGPAISRT
jgi:hypothetical protein